MFVCLVVLFINILFISGNNDGSNSKILPKSKDRNPSYPSFRHYTPSLYTIIEDEPFKETESEKVQMQSDLKHLIEFFSEYSNDLEQILIDAGNRYEKIGKILIEALYQVKIQAKSPEIVEVLLRHPYFGAYRLINYWTDPKFQDLLFSFLQQIIKLYVKRPVTDKWLLRMAVILTFKADDRKLRTILLQHPVISTFNSLAF